VKYLELSLAFWRDLCRVEVVFERPEEKFVYLECDSAGLVAALSAAQSKFYEGICER